MEKAVYRIIDANFNRAREANRVMEDFCRFYLNSAVLSGRCKKLRHDLSTAMGMLDSGKLLAARDTLCDVGTTIQVEGQLTRGSLQDCATAAAKRLTEALRTIAEAAQTINQTVAKVVETIRYRAYTLEKDILLGANARKKFETVRIYALLTAEYPAEIIRLTNACCEGGVDCIQLRVKNMPDDELLACAVELVGICRNSNVLSIINDRTDIAVAAGSDGVHLGQNDMPLSAARKIASSPMIFGTSTHNLDELNAAIEAGADYIGIGPAFVSSTKPHLQIAGLEYIKAASHIAHDAGVPHVAIGGITLDTIENVL
ncbi:MAG: thiamine phosphate synthase, partial [Sedimentisphaerales bacterium]|nr:thiamine phosphate synthase [Sedimentisphaerales bacterium]